MALKKIKDLAVKVGEYQSNGETKNRYENVGSLMEGDNGKFLLLKRTFNPAGVPNQDGRDSVIISFFEPKQHGQQQQSQAPAPAPTRAPALDADDDIPF